MLVSTGIHVCPRGKNEANLAFHVNANSCKQLFLSTVGRIPAPQWQDDGAQTDILFLEYFNSFQTLFVSYFQLNSNARSQFLYFNSSTAPLRVNLIKTNDSKSKDSNPLMIHFKLKKCIQSKHKSKPISTNPIQTKPGFA